MKITLFLTSIGLALAAFFSPADNAVLTGKVTDPAGEPLIGATVKALKNNELVRGTITDFDGNYRITPLDSGTYDVEFSYTGFATKRITGVRVPAGQTTVLDVKLDSSIVLQEVEITSFKIPLIEQDKTQGGMTLTSEQIKNLPTKKPIAIVPASTAGAPSGEGSEAKIKGSRSDATEYYIDGVRVESKPKASKEKAKVGEDEVVVPPPGKSTQPEPRAGLLTAGEWNDLHNWNRHWLDLLADGEIGQYQTMYGFFPKQRYTVMLTNEQDVPLADAVVILKGAGGEMVWEAKTDNTGKAELWAGIFDQKEFSNLRIEAWVNGKKNEISQPKPAKDGINFLKIKAECSAPKNVDIVWAVDATGSMGDELEYLKTELLDVIGRAKGRNPDLAFRMGTVFYRDKGDDYITRSSGLSPDIVQTVEFIKKQSADGGGDYPEAVHSALEEAVFKQKWSKNAIARICFLVLDASPHQGADINASLQKSIREAAKLGIRIVPVTASGIQKDTEFLMKFFGLATNGSYVFLTDHSGIGGKHLEPTSEEYKVEPLNDLLVRIITEYTTIKTCEGKSEIRFADDPQQQGQNGQALYYPNPASSQFTLELPFDVQSVTIYDSEGKAVRKLEKPQSGQHTILVNDLAEGFYTIRILSNGQMQSGKLVVVRA